MKSSFALPPSNGSRLVVINPNVDTLNAVPPADGSSDPFFVVFGQGSTADLGALLVYAQEGLDISVDDCHRTWRVLHSDGMAGQFLNGASRPLSTLGLGSDPHCASLRSIAVDEIRLSLIDVSESKVLSYLPGLGCFTHLSQYSSANTLNLFAICGLRSLLALKRGDIVLHIVERPSFSFTTLSSKPGPHFGVPTIEEFREMWKAWDLVTLGMIPSHLLHTRPIDLRHKCLFYLGHIPTQVHLSSTRVVLCNAFLH